MSCCSVEIKSVCQRCSRDLCATQQGDGVREEVRWRVRRGPVDVQSNPASRRESHRRVVSSTTGCRPGANGSEECARAWWQREGRWWNGTKDEEEKDTRSRHGHGHRTTWALVGEQVERRETDVGLLLSSPPPPPLLHQLANTRKKAKHRTYQDPQRDSDEDQETESTMQTAHNHRIQH